MGFLKKTVRKAQELIRPGTGVAVITSTPNRATGNGTDVALPVKAKLNKIQLNKIRNRFSDNERGGVIFEEPGQASPFDSNLLLGLGGEVICTLDDVFTAILATEPRDIRRGRVAMNKAKDLIKAMKQQNEEESPAPILSNIFVAYVDNIGKLEDTNSWKLIASVSSLCTFPNLMLAVLNKMFDLKTSSPEEDRVNLNKLQDDPLLFTFALRNVLARLAFYTKMTNVVYNEMKDQGQKNKIGIVMKDCTKSELTTFAFVGFNRLMSPNNNTGVSYSSDIDYKLVVDQESLKSWMKRSWMNRKGRHF